MPTLKGKANDINTRGFLQSEGNTVGAKKGLTLSHSPPPLLSASQIPYSCWKVSVSKTITVFPGINTMSWTLKVSRAAVRPSRGDRQQNHWNPNQGWQAEGFPQLLWILEAPRVQAAQQDKDIFPHPKSSSLDQPESFVSFSPFLSVPTHASTHS